MQRAWNGTLQMSEDVPIQYKLNDDVMMTLRLSPGLHDLPGLAVSENHMDLLMLFTHLAAV